MSHPDNIEVMISSLLSVVIHDMRDAAEKDLRALVEMCQQSSGPTEPASSERCVRVPIEPTEEMKVAGWNALGVHRGDCLLGDAYRAMLAAAPKSATPKIAEEAKVYEAIGRRVRMLVNGGSCDLTDSPKSFIETCRRLVAEGDEQLSRDERSRP